MSNTEPKTLVHDTTTDTWQSLLSGGDNIFWLLTAFLMAFALGLLLFLIAGQKRGDDFD